MKNHKKEEIVTDIRKLANNAPCWRDFANRASACKAEKDITAFFVCNKKVPIANRNQLIAGRGSVVRQLPPSVRGRFAVPPIAIGAFGQERPPDRTGRLFDPGNYLNAPTTWSAE